MKDHFSEVSQEYKLYRPDYPVELFSFLASICKKHDLVWDCGCGTGQASLGLSSHFKKVIASDLSQNQIHHAIEKANIEFHTWPAEQTDLLDDSVDLVTVAQALHWFDLTKFYQEVDRVLKPGGALAVWCYGLFEGPEEFRPQISKFYHETLAPYWPPERIHVDHGYQDLPFPYEKIHTPEFTIEKEWTCDQLLNYLGTWSAVQRGLKATHKNPLDTLSLLWSNTRSIVWPIHLIAGFKIK